MSIDFAGRVFLVTGGARGLGLAYVRALCGRGATVLIQDAGRDSKGLGEDASVAVAAATEVRSESGDAEAIAGSIETRDGCKRLVEDALSMCGRLDGFIHNAGWVDYEPILEVAEDSFDRMMTVGAKAPLWLAQAAWASMVSNKFGRIVLTTSDRGLYPEYVQRGLSSYAASKLAALGIANVLAEEGKPHGIVVNSVSPVAKTRMWGVTGEVDELLPTDVAVGVAYLMSEACTESGWILRASNGQFHATRSCEAHGVDYPRDLCAVRAKTVDEVADLWSRISVPNVEPRRRWDELEPS